MAVQLDVRPGSTLADVLRTRAAERPDFELFTFLEDGEEPGRTLTYADLLEGSRQIGEQLARVTEPGDRVLLLYEPSLAYVEAFFGCVCSGRIAVPVYPPDPNQLEKTLPRLMHIVQDAEPAAVATTEQIRQMAEGLMSGDAMGVGELAWCATDGESQESEEALGEETLDAGSAAFLQYTSGSTRQPRGVRVTHRNLLHNVGLIAETLGIDRETVGISWLPMYHDMGLIGKIITPVVVGCTVVLMSPRDFLRRPVRWLEAISRFGGTVSAAPNFAYDLCVRKTAEEDLEGLDLSTWRVALNGAEPVLADTLAKFAEWFEPAGFRREAFLPAYGLAESTLLVTGAKAGPRVFEITTESLEQGDVEFVDRDAESPETKRLVSSGTVPGTSQDVRIIDPDAHTPVEEGEVGEIWVSGPSVANGYWRRPDESKRRFEATLSDDDSGELYLRTGDLGFRFDDEFVVTGRREDLMIIRGRNIYPQDVEATVAEAHPAVRPGGMAVFSVDRPHGEVPVVVAEIERRTDAGKEADERRETETLPLHEVDRPPTPEEMAGAIREAVTQEHRIEVDDVVLIKPGSVPKTSSGKIQRNKCCKQYEDDELEVIGRLSRREAEAAEVPDDPPRVDVEEIEILPRGDRRERLKGFLRELLGYILERSPDSVEEVSLTGLGLDSLAAMEVQRHIEEQLGVRLFPSVLLGGATVSDIAEELAGAEYGASTPDTGAEGLGGVSSEIFEEPSGTSSRTQTIEFTLDKGGAEPDLMDGGGPEADLGGMNFSDAEIPGPEESREESAGDTPERGQLSWNEKGFWLYQRTYPESWAPNLYFAARLPEDITQQDVARGVRRILSRHPNLRSRYPSVEGVPTREYDANTEPDIERIDARGWSPDRLKEAFADKSREPFDLEAGPIYRLYLYVRRERSMLQMTVHHIVADFWSLEQLLRELNIELTGDEEIASPEVTYSDFVDWQQQLLNSERGEWCQDFWEETLSGDIPRLDFPAASTRDRDRHGFGDVYRLELDREVLEAVGAMAAKWKTTRYTILLATYQALLHRWTGQADLMVGAVASARTRSFFEDVLGMFANPLPLRSQVGPAMTFEQHLEATKQTLLEAMDAQDYPLQAMLERLDIQRQGVDNPIVQTLFASEQPREGGLQVAGNSPEELATVDLGLAGTAFDLTVMVHHGETEGEVRIQYNDAKFDASVIERMARGYRQILRQVLEEPKTPMGGISLTIDRERDRLSRQLGRGEWLGEADEMVHEMFERRAAEHPDRTAVQFEGGEWSYGELNRRANRLAHRLREAGVERGQPVGVSVERSPELIAALYAVLKAGGTYVALQPSLPDKRIEYMAEDAGVAVTIVDEVGRQSAAGQAIGVEAMVDEAYEAENPGIEVEASDLAYILYTSGTTGLPKGVMLPHRAVRNVVRSIGYHYPVDEDDVILQKTPYSFDISVSEIFNPLAEGARLVMTPEGAEREPRVLRDAIVEHGVTVLRMTPTELANLLETPRAEQCRSVRRVLACGEALTPAVRERFYEQWSGAELINLWGPTEAAVYGSWWECRADGDPETVPIGRPLANYSLYVLDEGLEVAPVGSQGELYTGGPSLARGYHELPKKTALAYLPDPHADSPGARMYKTGDLVGWNEDGQLEFYGRVDDQIQLRGLRVELGAIESHLEEAPGIKQAAVTARDGEDGRAEALVGYVVAEPGADPEAGQLRGYLGEYVQEAKIPGQYVELEEMPKTPSGKIDRKALPEPDEQMRSDERTAPETQVERQVADIWARHLELEEIGIHENFFEIGGHSLLAVRIQHDLTEQFETELPLEALFEVPTIAGIAERVGGDGDYEFEAIEGYDYGDEVPLSAGQQRMWFVQRLNPETAAFNVPGVVRLQGDLEPEALKRAIEQTVERHEILRTIFPMRGDEPVQKILETPGEGWWERADVSDREDPEAAAEALVDRTLGEPFDVINERPFRVTLIRVGDRDWILALVFHHIAIDEWTAGVLLDDLETLYRAEVGESAESGIQGVDDDERTAEWRQAWEMAYRNFDLESRDDPMLNTDGWIDSYTGEPYSDEEMRDWLQGCLEPLGDGPLGRTLEVGCGTGMVLFELADRADEYVGLDFSESALGYIDAVRERLEADLSHVELVHGRADEIGQLEGTFDTIVINSVIQYFPDQSYLQEVIRAAAEMLEAGGRLLIGDIRDRRSAMAFYGAVEAYRASDDTTQAELTDRIRRRFLQDDELLVEPRYLVHLARTIPSIEHLDLVTPPAEHRTEMSRFRYGAILYSRADRTAAVPDEVVGWSQLGGEVSGLEQRLETQEGSLLVTAIPNARVSESVQLQRWLQEQDDAEAPLSQFVVDQVDEASGVEPDQLRRLGEQAGYRVTITPSGDAVGAHVDAIFEVRTAEHAERRPLTPLTSQLAELPVPAPPSESDATYNQGDWVYESWETLLQDDRVREAIGARETTDRQPGLSDLPIQYADYALWQREQLEGEDYEEGLAFWKEHLEGVPRGVEWPMGEQPAEQADHRAEYVEFQWDSEPSERLRDAAHSAGTSLFVASYAAFAAFLTRYTRQYDVAIGLPVTMRQRPELRDLVGFFVNTIPMRADIPPGTPFDEWFERARDGWQASGPHQWIPLEQIVDAARPQGNDAEAPLLDVMFIHLPEYRLEGEFAGMEMDRLTDARVPEAKVDLEVEIRAEEDGFEGMFKFDAARFERSVVERMAEHFERFVDRCLRAPDRPMEQHQWYRDDERRQLLDEWGRGPAMDVSDTPVHRLIEQQVEAGPDRTALVAEDGEWSYAELERRSNRLARRLRDEGIRSGEPVGVAVERSPELVAALLGVNKAGAAYVALEPTLPEQRLEYMLRDADVDYVVTDEAGERKLDAYRRTPAPREVERQLAETPGVERTTLRTTQPWERGEETLSGAVVPEPGADLDELEEALRGRLAERSSVKPTDVAILDEDGELSEWVDDQPVDRRIRIGHTDQAEVDLEATGEAGETRPLSPDQRRLWLVQRLESSNVAYVVPEIAFMEGDLAIDALREATRDLVEAHPVLRSTFPEKEDGPVQMIRETDAVLDWEYLDVRDESDPKAAAEARLDELTGDPFDLADQAPVRFATVRLSDRRMLFAAIFHHIATDEWSSQVFWQTLEECYRARRAGETPELEGPETTFAAYARWREQKLDEEAKASALEDWQSRLEGAPTGIEWPNEKEPASGEAGPAGHVEFQWDGDLAERFEDWCRRRGVSPFFGLYSAFASYLAGYTDQRDLVIGVPATNRRRAAFDDVIGFFLNPLPMRVQWRPEESYGEFADRIWGDWRWAVESPEISVDEIVDALDAYDQTGATPLYDVIFTMVPEHGAPVGDFAGHRVSPVGKQLPYMGVEQAKCALNVGIEVADGSLSGSFVYDRDRLDREAVETMVEQFERFAAALVEAPDRRFEEHVEETLGRRPSPSTRADGGFEKPAFVDAVSTMEDPARETTRPAVDIDPDHPIYLLYTSGTTGQPKGVMVPHRAVANHVEWLEEAYDLGPSDVSMLKSSYGFDMSVSELFGPLTTGGTMAIAKPEGQRDPGYLVEAVRDFEVTCLRVVPTALNLMLAESEVEQLEETLRWVMLGGEALTPAVRDRFFETFSEVELHNPYGITETCVDVTRWQCRRDRRGDEVSLGTPMGNYQTYVTDNWYGPMPPQATGEIQVGGAGVTDGYRGMPRRTATAFVPDPYGESPGGRMYRSGDLARWDEEGELHYRGRRDDQIQLRGMRVELGEIEAHLEAAPGVRQAAVRTVGQEDGRADGLVAYCVPEEGRREPSSGELRSHLSNHLRAATIPGRYVMIEEMPRTASGKVDRSGLPEIEAGGTGGPTYTDPEGETEQKVADIWADVLGLPEVGRDVNFFEVGGNSLAAVKVHRRLEQAFDCQLEVVELFDYTTVEQIAEFLEEGADREPTSDHDGERGRRRRRSRGRRRRKGSRSSGD